MPTQLTYLEQLFPTLMRPKKLRLSESRIFAWAKAHFQRTGDWPTSHTGAVLDAEGETWQRIASALSYGLRGLAGGSSLSKLLRSRGIQRTFGPPRPRL